MTVIHKKRRFAGPSTLTSSGTTTAATAATAASSSSATSADTGGGDGGKSLSNIAGHESLAASSASTGLPPNSSNTTTTTSTSTLPPTQTQTLSPGNRPEDYGQKYHCDSCQADISAWVRIRCAECSDFDLCVECFSKGVEVRDHKKSHAYRVMDILDFPLFDLEWGADEELLLIEGLEMFGIGNWEQISEHLGATKSKYECCLHYVKTYIETQHWPMPDMSKEFDLETTRRSRKRLLDSVSNAAADREKKSLMSKGPIKYNKPPTSAPTNHEIAGFMPGRHEFETEYDNDAEQYVKDMVFDENDSEEDVLLKTTILDIYNTALDRRLDRKKFIFDRGLLDFKKLQLTEKKRPKEEKELHQKARPFARIQTAADYDSFVEGLLTESRLRQRIAQLQEYRRLGITTMKEATEYEKDKINRINNLKLTAGRDIYYLQHHERAKYTAAAVAAANASVSRPPTSTVHALTSEPVMKVPSRASTPSRLQSSFSSSSNNEASASSIPPHASSSSSSLGSRPGASAAQHFNTSSAASAHAHSTSASNAAPLVSNNAITISPTNSSAVGLGMNVSPTGSTDSVVGGGFGLGPSGNSNGFMNFGNAATDNNSSGAVRKDSAPLDISQSEGYELLSPQEQTLCTSLRLLPRAYLVIKETLISEYQKSGGTLKKRMARSLIKIDVNKTSRVWDFFITVSSK